LASAAHIGTDEQEAASQEGSDVLLSLLTARSLFL
jgi:hypothetical protein